VLLGRPVVWLAVQLFAAVAVLATCATAITTARRSLLAAARVRLAVLLLAGAVFAPWALYWGLLQP
jgi:hypothetical protein